MVLCDGSEHGEEGGVGGAVEGGGVGGGSPQIYTVAISGRFFFKFHVALLILPL